MGSFGALISVRAVCARGHAGGRHRQGWSRFFLVRVAPSGGPADASPSGGPSHSPAGGRAGQRSRPKAHREQTTFTWWWASVPSGEAKLGVCYQRCAPGASGQHFAGQCFGESVTTGTSFRVLRRCGLDDSDRYAAGNGSSHQHNPPVPLGTIPLVFDPSQQRPCQCPLCCLRRAPWCTSCWPWRKCTACPWR